MRISILLVSLLFICGCSESDSDNFFPGEVWLIPQDQVFDGGPGRDGIPSIDLPLFLEASSETYLDDSDLVIGLKIGNDIRAYPHRIMDWHEIVNDTFEDGQTTGAINYCPLTGSALFWESANLTGNKTYGVSGLLYNTNLILFDRKTGSLWSQMLQQSVNGPKVRSKPKTRQIIETTWASWKAMYPETLVLSRTTGFSRNYNQYPYGTYRSNDDLLFPLTTVNTALPLKERVLGVKVGTQSKVYPLRAFPSQITVIEEREFGLNYVVFGSSQLNFAVAYESAPNGTQLTFSPVQNSLPIVAVDNEGNEWNVFGEAVTGERLGQRLKRPESYIAYWSAWAAFFNNPDIHQF